MSQSQPWFTGSESTPSRRTSRFDDDSQRAAAVRPRRSCSDVSTVARSHGRARNRYGVAVSAPTGQICTVLPEKYDVNGSSGKVMTSVRVAAPAEVDERVARDLVGEAGAAAALDAALAVEQHEVADRDRLLEVALLLDEARLARTERERLVLQRALAAAVADRAVERVVDEQELEHAVLRLASPRRDCGVHDHAVGDRRRARDLQAAHALDLDEAHAAHADRLHALVPAEARDVGAVLLRDLDEQLPGCACTSAVDGDVTTSGPVDRDHVPVSDGHWLIGTRRRSLRRRLPDGGLRWLGVATPCAR